MEESKRGFDSRRLHPVAPPGGPDESARTRMMALDLATQLQEMKAIAGQADFAIGSVHAVTRDGALFIASASGSQLARRQQVSRASVVNRGRG